jgi:stage IV sporulation protein FB
MFKTVRVKFHITFWIFALAMLLQGKFVLLLSTVIAAVLHELAHARAAYVKGYAMQTITLTPFGATLGGKEDVAKDDNFAIALAGPFCNIVLAGFTAALWWVFPATYPYTQLFCTVNLSLAFFNLLPLYPLDGARMVLSLAKKPLRALKIMRFLGITFSFLCAIAFIVTAFFKINYSLGIMAVLLFISATDGIKREGYKHIALNAPMLKNTAHPITLKTVLVSEKLKLIELLKQIKPHELTTFCIIDEKHNKKQTLTEQQVGQLCLKNGLRKTIKESMKATSER